MNQKFPYFLFLFLCFSLNTLLNAQTQNDSLAKYSYEELKESIGKNEHIDIELSKQYTLGYLSKAKREKNKIQMAEAYYLLAVFNNDSIALKYSDSIINITKDIKDHKTYPARGYYFKGYCLYMFGKNQEALNNLLIALKFLHKKENERLGIDIRMAIISLISNWKDNDEIIRWDEELVLFLEPLKNKNIHYRDRYLIALNNLSLSYIGIKDYKKSLFNTKKGIKELIKGKETLRYYSFVCSAGFAQYYLGNHQAAIDSLQKALPHRNDHGKAMSNYYLGKSYDKLNKPEKAQFHFLKTDSIYQATKDIFPEMRNAYEHIIDYYKSKNDAENQIKYYDRLLETDKIIDSTYTYVTETIEKKYETPQAIAERARLVEELETKKNSWKYSFGIISAMLLAVIGFLVIVFRRQRYYKKRFESLMNISTPLNVQKTNPEVTETSISMVSAEALEAREGKKDLGVPQEIIDTILNQLQKFEASQKFTKQVSITSLAKNLKTNPKYLSKVINWHYKKNFSHYISELRIEYVISKLKEDSKFRNYTIKAIAEEAGFGNTESFSKAFHKSTGIKPSYFIKELHKRMENS